MQPNIGERELSLDELDRELISEEQKTFIKAVLRVAPSVRLVKVDGELMLRGIRLKTPQERAKRR